MVSEEQKGTPQNQKKPARETNPVGIGENGDSVFSPRFKSAAAMAGWDEEALLLASLIVEDTPERDSKYKKRSNLNFKTPPTNSTRKRRAHRSPQSIPAAVINLDEEEPPRKDSEKKKREKKNGANTDADSKVAEKEISEKRSGDSSSSSALPCIDKLREELSCAICLEICFEPSTTPCGHSFCRKCLRSAADKCGKRCPKCREMISNGRSCTVNTVLWNTIQLLFPQEVEARKAAGALNSREAAQCLSPEKAFYGSLRNRNTQTSGVSSSRRRGTQSQDVEDSAFVRRILRELEGQSQGRLVNNSRNQIPSSARARMRRGIASQDEDAALALRMQREEFMEAFRESRGQSSSRPLSLARANVRAMASRAINLRTRDRR
ncbi:hypothetical protein L6164_005018 [Bauhinia variegata]|uniref:Uncharacterized protein n=1 Tax=Bauhinia variegata TaxID=167791 RepID=A0ACB9PQ01_BAUVA|nr:hypothetical protein L6164_005018 [Bauhinia variegata]